MLAAESHWVREYCDVTYTSLVSNRIFNDNFVQNGSVIQLDEESVADGALLRVVVVRAELLLLNAEDLGTKSVDAWVSSGRVGAKEDAFRSVNFTYGKKKQALTSLR